MTHTLNIRVKSFALAAAVTFSVFAGIDTLALQQQAGNAQMSQAPAATSTAATAQPARS